MSYNDIPHEFMHCFNLADEIPTVDPMEVEEQQQLDLYQTAALEWHHWQPGTSHEPPKKNKEEPELKRLMDLDSYKEARQNLAPATKETEAPVIKQTENAKRSASTLKVRGPYRSYTPAQVQELLDLVIEQGMPARQAGLTIGIVAENVADRAAPNPLVPISVSIAIVSMTMLTFGQAACLVLGEPPENQEQAIEYFRNSRLTVVYLYGEDPLLRPVAIGKKVQELNPYLYRAYPETMPFTPSVLSLPSMPSKTTPSTAAEMQSNSQPLTVSVQSASIGTQPRTPLPTTLSAAPSTMESGS
ncbi:hypothetical protein EC973_000218 [Apophysomyces ossiformis]|uniref:Uncharacterized protein n=1 Tax=Apophysomyces ossiformis TaxID=679940 RepID=A0A8H7EU52_9FUNG|nr:hypothetical protein EC973_000218 [Apophysomyces ossiformis]